MATKAGVWIDHAKAVVVVITDQGEQITRFKSELKKPARSASGARAKNAYAPNDFVAEDHLERKLTAHLNKYYDEVIACIHDAEAILILGPGEAKGELKKRIKSKKLCGRVADLQATDKMTDREITANVRQHFLARPEKKGGKTLPSPRRSKSSS